ncbi:MAG TPA: undecaprenyl-phosphate glucose phosphotransferase [Steroidobacteraceae bacterium]|jgi:putative colanic acid biosynthesis UDP-glucose lipid carrier transferase|nr:undecaprenyl-phosphate glucose phosphotransferase [Steroidobacteraceae bacterium]
MTDPVMFTRGFSIALISLLQAIMPPLISVGMLVLVCRLYDVRFSDFFQVLAMAVAVLSSVLPRGRMNGQLPVLPAAMPLALSVLVRWMVIVAVLLGVGFITKYSEDFSRRVVLTWVVVTPALLVIVALYLHEVMRRLLNDPSTKRRVAFVGCTEASLALAQRITNNSQSLGLMVLGFFDDRSSDRLGLCTNANVRLLGQLSDIVTAVHRDQIDAIFIALPIRQVQRVMDLVQELRNTTVSIYYVPDLLVFDLIQARTAEILGMPVVAMCETPFYGYGGLVKRITDVAFALAILTIAAPLMVLIAIGVKLTSPGPVLFKQRRYGLDGREILVYKFRTMTVLEDGDKVHQATRTDSRVTPFGRILRRYSLDELPQLFNVLQGTMSLVGPRPHAVAHNEEYRRLIKGYMVRHKAPPGITGLAQINGCRGETARVEDMEARLNYDLEYLRRWSPLLDLKILALTAVRILKDEKAY